jgi:hypothetical protein
MFLEPNKGVPVTENYRLQMIEEMIKWMNDNPNENFSYARTGNSIVILIREYAEDEKPTARVEVFDCTINRDGVIYVG